MNAAEIRLKRAKVFTEARKIVDQYKKDERIKAEDQAKIDKFLEEARECDKQLREIEEDEKRRKEIEEGFKSLGESTGRQTDPTDPAKESRGADKDKKAEREQREATQRQAFDRFLRRGHSGLTAEMRSALGPAHGLEQMMSAAAGVTGEDDEEARALSAVTGSAGGFTVPTLYQPDVSEAMKAFWGVRMDGSEHIVGDSGQDLPFITNDDTGNVGELLGESASATTQQDLVFGQTMVSTYMYSSKLVLVPIQLLQDAGFDIGAYLFKKLTERIGRIVNTHCTTGTGSGQPRGIVTAVGTSGTGIGVTAAANNAITADELLQLQHSVDPAYRMQSSYKLSDGLLQRVRILKDSNGRYLLNDATAGAPATIWGKPYSIFTDMASSITATTNVVLFGRASDYKTREVRGLTLFRFGEVYMTNLQVGFLAFGRFGGNYVNPGNFSVKALRTPA